MHFENLLPGHIIDLEQLTNDHISELEPIAIDDRIWQNLPYNIKDKHAFNTFINDRLQQNLSGQQVTYVVRNKSNGQVCGCTGFINIDAVHHQLEIGPTWLSPI